MSLVEKKQPKKKHTEQKLAHNKKLEQDEKNQPAKSTKATVEKDAKKQIEADTLDEPKEPHPEIEKRPKKHKAPKKKEVVRKPPRRVPPARELPVHVDISERHIHELARHTVLESHDLEQLISKQQELKDAGRSLDGA